VALAGLDGGIHWMCLPRFDSEPVFCGLLDRERGGHFTIAPDELMEARQRYEPDTGVLVTELRSPTGLVRLMLNWIALEGPAAIAEFVKEKDPSVQFADEYVGICHICNEVLTRLDVRRVIAEHLPEIAERVSTHRAFFEGIRGDEELVASYLRP
jgi:Trehalase-like, N-terminal